METEIINAIGSVGFPIVACCYMAWMHQESQENRVKDEQRHSEERTAMTEVLTKMNVTLDRIIDMLKSKDDENDA